MGEPSLNDEQKEFLEECENEFKDRYTESDAKFMKIKNMKRKDPPIVDPWYGRNRRFNNDRGGRNRRFRDRFRPSNERHRYPDERNRQFDGRHRDSEERYRQSDGRSRPYDDRQSERHQRYRP